MLSILIFATAAPTNRLQPYGGEHKPIARLTDMITPNWIGSMPRVCTVGSNRGAMTIIAGTVSRNSPMTSKIALISSKMMIGFSDTVVRKCEIICGTCSKVIKVENTVEYPSRNDVTPLSTEAAKKVWNSSFLPISL